MAMLAEPKRKQKWTLNPRGKQWSDDSSKFGQRMLEKMGWTSGKGLGANEQGMTEHLRVKLKDDQSGLGFSQSHQDKLWTKQQESFNDLLQQLASTEDEVVKPVEISSDLSGKSLEMKSRHSRARVHYKKFTRGKDVNKYSEKDLANIFGKKDLNEKPKEEEKAEEVEEEFAPIGSSDTRGGVVTIKGGSMNDYFNSKMSTSLAVVNIKAESESDSETRYVGFGFNTEKSDDFAFTNAGLDLSNEPVRKRKSEFLDSPSVDSGSKKRKKHKVESFAFENPGLDLVSREDENKVENPMEVKRIPDFVPVECIPQNVDSVDSLKKSKKKKKSRKDTSDGFVNDGLNLETNDKSEGCKNGLAFEVARDDGLANSALDLTDETPGKKRVTFNDVIEFNVDSKKKLTKLDKFEVEVDKPKKKKKKKENRETNVFVNEALDVEDNCEEAIDNEINEKKSGKRKRKRDRINSLATIEEIEEDKESSVTFSDSLKEDVEEEVVKKKKKKEKEVVDASEEVDTSEPPKKSKKKKQKEKTESVVESENFDKENSIDNKKAKKKKQKEKMDLVVENENLDKENLVEEKKTKKKKHKEKIELVVENENLDKENAVEDKKAKKKKRKEKTDLDVESENLDKKNSVEEKKTKKKKQKEKLELEVESENFNKENSVEDKLNFKEFTDQKILEEMLTNPRKKLKNFFIQSPILNFTGSNVHEIKGYGI